MDADSTNRDAEDIPIYFIRIWMRIPCVHMS